MRPERLWEGGTSGVQAATPLSAVNQRPLMVAVFTIAGVPINLEA